MATVLKPDAKSLFADKKALIEIMDRVLDEMGIVPDPDATAEKAREMMLADGVKPEDCEFSRAIIAARDE